MRVVIGLMLSTLAVMAGCQRYQVIPDSLKDRVNERVTFEQIKQQPLSAKGQMVVLGGEVLGAVRLADRTRIEVLQTPLSSDLVPDESRSTSQGRFLAYDQRGEIVDPAILREGTRVTIIGELQDPTVERIGETEYAYPTLAIRDMTVWDLKTVTPAGGTLIAPYGGGYPGGSRPYTFWSGTRVAG